MKRNSMTHFFVIMSCFGTVTAAAADDEPVIPPEKFVYCTVCHGVRTGGNPNIEAPRLSGLSAWYVERQLRSFSKGWRGVHEQDLTGQDMRPMAEILSDAEIERAAQYVKAVESALPPITLDGDAGRGKSLYTSCAACHGENASGNEALSSPALAGLNDWYLLTQLRHFKAGVRGNNANDISGQQMRAAAGVLADEQAMKDVIRYISTLRDH